MSSEIKRLLGLFVGLLAAATTPCLASSTEAMSLQTLLDHVHKGQLAASNINEQREHEFAENLDRQEKMLAEARTTLRALEQQSTSLEQTFNGNEIEITEKRAQRDARMGTLKELFGHMTSAAGDLRTQFQQSIASAQFKERDAFLDALIEKMQRDSDLPTINEIEQLWFEMHRELTASAEVVKFNREIGTDGAIDLLRIGLFNLVSNGQYLSYDGLTDRVSILPRQPQDYIDGASQLQTQAGTLVSVGIDPTGANGGAFLRALINSPTLVERWRQGGIVGYFITLLACIALLIGVWRHVALSGLWRKFKRQLATQTPLEGNALGRVLTVGQSHQNADTETLELKLSEAIIKERPAIEIGLPMLKIIATIAPLLGLLGTVVGMIIVFQAITVYGSGDPKAMAGGISGALVTTVLGLIVAIPALLMHALLTGKARQLLHILEEQSAGLVAERAGH